MTKGLRQRKKPTRADLEYENDSLRAALEDIADILEEVGILEPPNDWNVGSDEEPDDEEPAIIIVNPEPAGIVDPKE
jgi:hypothetical protein